MMKSNRQSGCVRTGLFSILMGVTGLGATTVHADVSMPAILTEHAVLQRSDHTRVWGKAGAGEKVKVEIGQVSGESAAAADGKWSVTLDLTKIGEGPFDLMVQGNNRLVVSDVLVGEVWLLGGQSNMAYALNRSSGGAEEIARSANRRLRQFTVGYNPAAEPQEKCKGSWMVADPANSGNFSAVGYYFAQDLQKSLNTPVGLVRSAWAGTAIMSWISDGGMTGEPELKQLDETAKQRVIDYPKQKQAFVSDIAEWENKTGRQDRTCDVPAFAEPAAVDADWKKVALHNTRFKTVGLPDAGALWLRKTVVLPANTPPSQSALSLIIGAFDRTYFNGKQIGETTEATCPGASALRYYKIPPDLYKQGENTIAIRIFTPTEGASFGSGYVDVGTSRIQLGEDWLAKSEYELPPLADKNYPQIPNAPGTIPSALYNGMINPLTPATLAGVIWYQGEQDTGRKAALYNKMLCALIADWRERFQAELHFCICQLPNNGKKTASVGNSNWAEIREAQRQALKVPGTSLITTIDVGEEDVHPPQKKPVGERLALAALTGVYGKSVASCGPLFESMRVEDDKAIISFRSVESGLVARPLPADYLPTYSAKQSVPLVRNSPDSQLEGFAIRGEDNKWVWAQAKIEGSTVVVWSPSVAKPVGVRYAWADNPTCNLYNGAGLPASPFQASK